MEPIAIVGIGCRLPGDISSVDELFLALREGRDCVTEIPSDRWPIEDYYDPDPLTPGKSCVRCGGFVSDIDRFDAGFFGISDAEAARMDPQQRMLLQTVWHALENAGQSAEELRGTNTGVFLAMMNTNDYCQLKGTFEGLEGITGYDAMGDAVSISAGRISHFFDLEGPCMAVDTACSSSVVALHLARQHLLAGDCDAAIVAGVSAILHPGLSVAFSKLGLMSRTGRCRTFDDAADGYVRSEGCAALLVRRQSTAMARNDRIVASVICTAVNQDGHTPALIAPNAKAQEKLMRLALARVGAHPGDIGYVEAHGTGTPVGDPIEMKAISSVYGSRQSEHEQHGDDCLFVGSAKSNFGHTEAPAGLIGIAKVALSLEREMIFPSLHFNRLNANINLDQARVRVPTSVVAWPRRDQPRLAGVNSFGYSGTNAHALLQEAPLRQPSEQPVPMHPAELVVLSAKSTGSLQEVADRWSEFLERDDNTALGDIAFTASVGRTHLRHRLAAVGTSKAEIVGKLKAWRDGRMPAGLSVGQATGKRGPQIAFMFTGQGAQYAQMARQLYDIEPVFRESIDRSATFMDRDLGSSLREVLFGSSSEARLGDTRYVQPAMFAVECALADLLADRGVRPDVVIGHSIGEMAAAVVAGMLDAEQAARFVTTRSRLMGELPREGRMLAVEASVEEVSEWIRGRERDVSIAAINGPVSLVVSGKSEVVDEVAALASAANRRSKVLTTSHAFHSPLMDPVLEELGKAAALLRMSPPRIPIISNVTGDYLDGGTVAQYWGAQMRQPVLFHKGIETIIQSGCSVLVEIGPHPALIPAVLTAGGGSRSVCVPTLKRDRQDFSHMLETLGALHAVGVPVRLDSLFDGRFHRRVNGPLYPFRRDRYWLWDERPPVPGSQPDTPPPQIATDLHPLLGRAVSVGSRRVVFEATLGANSPWVDHRVLGSTIFPGSAYLEMAARGFAASTGQDWCSVVLRDVVFERPLVLRYGKSSKVTLTLNNVKNNGTAAATFVIAEAASNVSYCRGRIATTGEQVEQVELESALGRRDTAVEIGPFYGELRRQGLEYGARFATVREIWTGTPDSGEAFGRVRASAFGDESDADPYTTTVLIDGCLQVFAAALRTLAGNGYDGAFVPVSLQSFTIKRQLPNQVWSHVAVSQGKNGVAAVVRVRILSDSAEVLADIEGLELRQKATLFTETAERPSSGPDGARVSQSRDQLIEQLRGLPKKQQVGVIVKWVASEVKDIMGHAAEDIDLDRLDPTTAFLEVGLDSLLVTELQRRIQEKLEFRFQPMQALDYQSIESLAEYIVTDVLMLESTQPAVVGAGAASAGGSSI